MGKQYFVCCIPKFIIRVLFFDESMFTGEGDGGIKMDDCNIVNNI